MDILYSILAFAAGIFIIWLFFKIFGFAVKVLWKFIINALVGALILIVFNLIGGLFGFTLTITPLTALITGVFGVPGVVILVIIKLLA